MPVPHGHVVEGEVAVEAGVDRAHERRAARPRRRTGRSETPGVKGADRRVGHVDERVVERVGIAEHPRRIGAGDDGAADGGGGAGAAAEHCRRSGRKARQVGAADAAVGRWRPQTLGMPPPPH